MKNGRMKKDAYKFEIDGESEKFQKHITDEQRRKIVSFLNASDLEKNRAK